VTLDEAAPYARRQLEKRAVDAALLGFLGVRLPEAAPSVQHSAFSTQHKGVGGACGEKLIPLCRPIYGDKLPIACRTCPGPRSSRGHQ
jgi:hypothetical protein